MTVTCKEDNNLNYQEIKCVNISQIKTVTNYETLNFDYLRFMKSHLRQYGSGLAQCLTTNLSDESVS